MKLSFGSLTLGGGPNYFLNDDWKGLDGKLDNTTIKIPRSDYSRNISADLSTKIRTFSGVILGDSVSDFRLKKRNFLALLKQEFTFTLTDDYKNADGSVTTYETYIFNGKIITAEANARLMANKGEYTLQIVSEDPLLYSSTIHEFESKIHMLGFSFPLTFPLTFSFADDENQMSVINVGTAGYPTITITGPLTNLRIKNENSGEVFTYAGSLTSADTLVITPIVSDPIKVRKNGVSVLSSTNANWDTFLLITGTTVFTFSLDSGEDTTTGATLTFRDAYMGI